MCGLVLFQSPPLLQHCASVLHWKMCNERIWSLPSARTSSLVFHLRHMLKLSWSWLNLFVHLSACLIWVINDTWKILLMGVTSVLFCVSGIGAECVKIFIDHLIQGLSGAVFVMGIPAYILVFFSEGLCFWPCSVEGELPMLSWAESAAEFREVTKHCKIQ